MTSRALANHGPASNQESGAWEQGSRAGWPLTWRPPRGAFGWEALLLAIPVAALVGFGFLALERSLPSGVSIELLLHNYIRESEPFPVTFKVGKWEQKITVDNGSRNKGLVLRDHFPDESGALDLARVTVKRRNQEPLVVNLLGKELNEKLRLVRGDVIEVPFRKGWDAGDRWDSIAVFFPDRPAMRSEMNGCGLFSRRRSAIWNSPGIRLNPAFRSGPPGASRFRRGRSPSRYRLRNSAEASPNLPTLAPMRLSMPL